MSIVAKKIMMGSGAVALPSDDQFNRVSFLSHFDGSNNGVNNAFDDGSDSNHTITANGNVTQGSFGPFARPDGEWGVDLSVDEDMLTVPNSTDLNLGTGDFTLECFIFVQNPENNGGIMSKRDNEGGFNNSYRTSYRTDSKKVSFAMSTGSVEILSPVVEKGIWTHIAVVRNSGTLSIYAAGVQGGTATSNTADEGASWPFTIGSQYQESGASPQFSFIGLISNVRFVKGTAVYSGSSFTPPTGKLTAITNTKLLTCQSNRFVDNSASAHTLTPTGNAAISAFGPFLTSSVYKPAVNGASANFNSVSDYITVADSSDFTLGNTFTLEAWIYPTASNNYNSVQNQNGAAGYYWAHVSGEQMQFYRGVTSAIQHDSAASSMVNQWTHVAYVCDAGTAYHYINGVRSGSSVSMSVADISAVITIGAQGGSFPFPGFISDYRMVVGTAVYSGSTYTVPTAPLTAITNTKLLLNMADGQAIDSAAQNNLTLYGNAKISTGQAKFGNTSLYLDGSDDYLVVNNHRAYGTGPFTIEMFFRLDSVSGSRCLYDDRPDGASGDYISLIIASGAVNFYVGTTLKVDAGSISANTFYHIALCRSGTDTKLFLDGTQIGSTFSSDTTNYLNTGILRVGTNRAYSNDLAGYIDDFRISHMARYTSNFTAPTAAFPDKGQ